ncbi:hypothetical protein COHA_006196 [Chlorella ohadii]|uniref:SBP-type domain-containing protein n=1 Tax=Chlorella ohadii TaxID=2649997 RepID=A0AAD5H135_9CHLO|nr:hypothetical protein COHA_006196 [Chlorella ohadii]
MHRPGSKASKGGPLVCQVGGCGAALDNLKAYYRRYKVCEEHQKAPFVIIDGQQVRFCQQCGYFLPLGEFDGEKRSCRACLQRHNARRRKRQRDGDGGGSSEEAAFDAADASAAGTAMEMAQLVAHAPQPMPISGQEAQAMQDALQFASATVMDEGQPAAKAGAAEGGSKGGGEAGQGGGEAGQGGGEGGGEGDLGAGFLAPNSMPFVPSADVMLLLLKGYAAAFHCVLDGATIRPMAPPSELPDQQPLAAAGLGGMDPLQMTQLMGFLPAAVPFSLPSSAARAEEPAKAEASLSADGPPPAVASPAAKDRQFREGAETRPFQAEVSRMMDIIIHSLYSNKDIFLRELISNAADALDKIRFLSLTDKKQLGEGEDAKLEIRLSIDKDRKMISLRDRGVGMTKDELVNNLGTIAKSGTSAFLEQMQKGGDLNLIGQFGVGFYSVYLVADYVEVVTKHNDDKQYVWESKADGSYAVSEDTEGERLGRGTQINIYLKESCQEYLQEDKLRGLVQRYSEFINFPILMLTTRTEEKEVPIEEEEKKADEAAKTEEKKAEEEEGKKAEDAKEGETVEVEDEDEDEEKKPKTKKVTETITEWKALNDNQALWLRPPGNVSDDEYAKFYKALSKNEWDTPLAHTHFKAEGDVEFKAVLFVPGYAPPDLYDNYYAKKPSMKLYVRRVFISDSFEELLPKWLSFLVGLVDSDTMPLNVSREMLQLHEGLKVIRKKLVRKAIDMIKKLADGSAKAAEELEAAQKEAGEEEAAAKKEEGEKSEAEKAAEEEKAKAKKEREEKAEQFNKFWRAFGKSVKMGIIEDPSNRRRLLQLLRFHSSKSPDKLTSLSEYVARMKEGQKHIYYLVGTSREEVEKSPFVEALVEKGYEVLYMTDPLDEYVMQNVQEFEDREFANVSKEDLKLADDKGSKKREKALKEEFKPLAKWWKEALGAGAVESVKVSRRLSATPCVVVASKYGWSATMERIARTQTLGDAERAKFMRGQRSLEINPRHPLIKELKAQHEAQPESAAVKDAAQLLYQTCLLESGFLLDDMKDFNARVFRLLAKEMKVDDLTVPKEEPEDEAEEAEEAAAAEGEKKEEGEEKEVKIKLEGAGSDALKIEEVTEQLKAQLEKEGKDEKDDAKDEL